MSRYAASTNVSSDRSRAEIEKILSRYGATSFMYGWMGNHAVIGFDAANRRVKFSLPMPDKNSDEFWVTPSKKYRREPQQAEAAYEQAVRQRWRALALMIKAKLEAVETGITCFDEEFLPHIQLPNGQTVGQFMLPQIESAYQDGVMPPLLGYDK